MRKRASRVRAAEMGALFLEGLSISAIARRLNVDRRTVGYHLDKKREKGSVS